MRAQRRQVLGFADLADDQLAEVAARSLRADTAQLVGDVDVVAFGGELTNISTTGLWRVSGRALAPQERCWSVIVKSVRSIRHWPMFHVIPADQQELAARGFPWAAEPYRNGVSARLPDGLRMPTTYQVVDGPDDRAAIWMEEGPTEPHAWEDAMFGRAAELLGQLAASSAVAEVAPPPDIAPYVLGLNFFWFGRCLNDAVPALRTDALWEHPLVAQAADARLRADLAQLVAGLVNLGAMPASRLPGLVRLVVPAYVRGMRAQGAQTPEPVVRRVLALVLTIFTAFTAVPSELLQGSPLPGMEALVRERAAMARFILDLLGSTS